MMYRVTVLDFGPGYTMRTVREVSGLSLDAAWRKCRRASRRGVGLFGGRVDKGNWGMTGGRFPEAYRSAVIRVA